MLSTSYVLYHMKTDDMDVLDAILSLPIIGSERIASRTSISFLSTSPYFSVGRRADTSHLGLEKVGVHVDKDGKIPVKHEQTVVPHIYAIGDVIKEGLELTPVAIKAGR